MAKKIIKVVTICTIMTERVKEILFCSWERLFRKITILRMSIMREYLSWILTVSHIASKLGAQGKKTPCVRWTIIIFTYFIILRKLERMDSNEGLSSGLSFQHFSISSINSSGQSLRLTAGRNGGLSLAATLVIISTN